MPTVPIRKPGRPRDEHLAARRRAEILDIAAQLFAQHGYAKTDVQEVADTLGVGKGTIYRYFPSKSELFLGAVDRGMALLRSRVEADVADIQDPLEILTGAIRSYLVFFESYPELVELFIQERAAFKDRDKPAYFQHREANIGPWQELAEHLIATGRLRPLSLDRLTVVGDLLYGVMFTNYFARQGKSAEAQAEDFLDIVFHGILGDVERLK
jgi:AcrR family transcriptional regulator